METLDGRLHSFDKQKAKAGSSKSAWPHPSTYFANPRSLAEAGFYFKPSKTDPDNVACFMCKKELGGWDEDDNPFEVHVSKSPKCPWAVARCSLEFDVDSDGKFVLNDPERLPTNKALEKARTDTFGGKLKWWPHDSVKGHGATSKKMAKAGFVYTPQAEGDDTATCFYCNVSLSGWDEDDDPTEEHRKRVERSEEPCPFFESEVRLKIQSSQESGTKATKKKGRATRQKEPSEDEDDAASEAPPTAKPQSSRSTAAKATKKKARSTKQVEVVSDDELAEEAVVEETKPTGKKGKQKQTSSVASSSTSKAKKPAPVVSDIEDSEDLREDDDPSLKVQPAPVPRKSTRKAPSSKSKPASSKPSLVAKTRTRKPTSEDDQNVDEDGSQAEKPSRPPSRASRAESKKTKSKGKEKPPSDVDARVVKETTHESDAPSESEGPAKKETAARSRSRSKSKPRAPSKKPQSAKDEKPALLRAAERVRVSMIPEADDEMVGEEDEQEPTPVAKPASKKTKSKKVVAQSDTEEPTATKGRNKSQAKQAPPSTARSETGRRNANANKDDVSPEDTHHVQNDATTDDGDHMDVDNDTHYETAYEERTPSPAPELPPPPPVPATVALDNNTTKPKSKTKAQPQTKPASQSQSQPQPPPPFPNSPSDFKVGPPKGAHVAKIKKALALKKAEMEMEADGRDADVPMHNAQPPTTTTSSANANNLRYRTPPRAQSPPSDREVDADADDNDDDDVDADKENEEPPPLREARTPPRAILAPAANISAGLGSQQTQPLPTTIDAPAPAAAFIPALASAPLAVAAQLTPAEREMTVEQWIRHEMERQAAQLRADGERRIDAFRTRAEEIRRRIEAL